MRIQTSHFRHDVILQVVDEILNNPGEVRAQDCPAKVGFSRYYLSRFFAGELNENLGDMIRRIRLERAAYQLLFGSKPVEKIAEEAAYAGVEAFSRPFKAAFRVTPRDFRVRGGARYHLEAANDIHWSPTPQPARYKVPGSEWLDTEVVRYPSRRLSVIRHEGPASHQREAWHVLRKRFAAELDDPTIRKYVVYHDNALYSRRSDTLRSDVGIELRADQAPLPATRLLVLPGGAYVVGMLVDFESYLNAWIEMQKIWIPRTGARPINIPSYDEYLGPPDTSKSPFRIGIGLNLDLGEAPEPNFMEGEEPMRLFG